MFYLFIHLNISSLKYVHEHTNSQSKTCCLETLGSILIHFFCKNNFIRTASLRFSKIWRTIYILKSLYFCQTPSLSLETWELTLFYPCHNNKKNKNNKNNPTPKFTWRESIKRLEMAQLGLGLRWALILALTQPPSTPPLQPPHT